MSASDSVPVALNYRRPTSRYRETAMASVSPEITKEMGLSEFLDHANGPSTVPNTITASCFTQGQIDVFLLQVCNLRI